MSQPTSLLHPCDPVAHIYGVAMFGPERKFHTLDAAQEVLDTLASANVTRLSTAQLYGQSESTLGHLDAGRLFHIDTKAAGGVGSGALERDELVKRAKESLVRLKVKQVDVFYIHSPDPCTPLSSTLEGIQELYLSGMFRRFGLSGYLASDVELIHAFCTTNKYVLPTVYQGCYNPIARRCEIELMPTLRRLGISFYAYAPSGGGLLAKTKQEVKEGKGRFDSSSRGGQVLRFLYCRPAILHSLDEWNHIAVAAGCSGNELAIRWVRFNSTLSVMYDDAVVWSCSTIEQLQETLVAIEKGPLNQEILRRINSIWELVKDEAPLDNTNG